LCHFDGLDARVGGVGFGPRGHAAVLETVAAADDDFEIGNLLALLARGLLLGGEGSERIGDEDASSRAEAIVVQV
jgi:hypothetical protein